MSGSEGHRQHRDRARSEFTADARDKRKDERIARLEKLVAAFKDLTARAAAALKPEPAKTAPTLAKETEPKASGKDAPAKSKTS